MWNPFAGKDNSPDGAAPELVTPPCGGTRSRIAEIEHLNATAVVTFTVTELTGQEATEELADLLERLIAAGSVNVVLDVQNVHEMDSATLGVLVKAVRLLEKSGGRMALVNTDRTVEYLFKLTKLDRVFPICTDVMAALATVERPHLGRAG